MQSFVLVSQCMQHVFRPRALFFFLLLLASSCATNRNLVYFSDLTNAMPYEQAITNFKEPVIQPGDQLSVTVSSLSPESNALFNNGILLPTNSTLSSSEATRKAGEGYLVDGQGTINFPVLGSVRLGGLTRTEAIRKLTDLVSNSVKNPIVNVSFLNFRVTVLGEVNKPGNYLLSSEHPSLLDALGLAGDLTPYGLRENVLIIREREGKRTSTRVDLTNKATLESPFFYVQQNDVVYVSPDKARNLQASTRTVNLPIYISIASIVAILISSLAIRR